MTIDPSRGQDPQPNRGMLVRLANRLAVEPIDESNGVWIQMVNSPSLVFEVGDRVSFAYARGKRAGGVRQICVLGVRNLHLAFDKRKIDSWDSEAIPDDRSRGDGPSTGDTRTYMQNLMTEIYIFRSHGEHTEEERWRHYGQRWTPDSQDPEKAWAEAETTLLAAVPGPVAMIEGEPGAFPYYPTRLKEVAPSDLARMALPDECFKTLLATPGSDTPYSGYELVRALNNDEIHAMHSELVEKARATIWSSHYTFDDQPIIDSYVAAARGGVPVKILLSADEFPIQQDHW